jgi:hypothetical protein
MRGASALGGARTGAIAPQHRIAIICATIAYPALENFGQKSMIFISELTKRTYRSKKESRP